MFKKSEVTKASLTKRVQAFGNTVKAMRDEGQNLLLLIYQRAEKHGDYSLANMMLEVSEGLNRKLLTDHMRKYAGLKTAQDFTEEELAALKADADKWDRVKDNIILGWSGKAYIRDHFDMAKANKWWAGAKAEKKALQMDINDLIDNLCKRIDAGNKALQEARDAGKVLDNVNLVPDRAHVEKLIRKLPVNEFALEIIDEAA